MLEVTILKVKHGGSNTTYQLEEAAKLLPYIAKCDVFSEECAAATSSQASMFEQEWDVVLRSNISRSRFLSITSEGLGTSDESQRTYLLKQKDYLYRNKKPIIVLERFNDQDAQYIHRLKDQAMKLESEAFEFLTKGKVDDFFRQYWNSIILETELNQMRDREISKNLGLVERNIVGRYPELAKNPNIKLALAIGSFHYLERHCTLPITPVLLTDNNPFLNNLYVAAMNGKKLEEMKPDMLKFGIWQRMQHLRRPIPIDVLHALDYHSLFDKVNSR